MCKSTAREHKRWTCAPHREHRVLWKCPDAVKCPECFYVGQTVVPARGGRTGVVVVVWLNSAQATPQSVAPPTVASPRPVRHLAKSTLHIIDDECVSRNGA